MLKQAYYAAGAGLAAIEKRRQLGRNIFEEEWDICIVLDSARLDMLRSHAISSDILDTVESAWSVGSVTTEWLTNTFSQDYADEIEDTTLVSATPHTETVFLDREWLTSPDATRVPYPDSPAVSPEDFAGYHELWKTHATVENVVPPWTMRDATIEAWRESERVVAHWMQPHEPFIAEDAALSGGDATEKNVWAGLQAGTLEENEVWQSYAATLAMALRHVEEVLTAVDARVLITADHGNAFGEWGIYGHPFGFPQPAVRRVPWCVVDAARLAPVETTGVLSDDAGEQDRDAQLRALGYL